MGSRRRTDRVGKRKEDWPGWEAEGGLAGVGSGGRTGRGGKRKEDWPGWEAEGAGRKALVNTQETLACVTDV